MTNTEKLKTIFLKSISSSVVVMISILFLFSACVQKSSGTRKSTTTASATATNGTSTKVPDFTQGTNFIQNGGTIYTASVAYDLTFSDIMQLRGKDVDSYIRTTGTQTIVCLTGRFSGTSQVNIQAAIPHSVYNFTTQTLEYYYSVGPSDETNNKNFCQKSGLINKLYELYSTYTPTYKLSSLCQTSSCAATIYTSQPLELYTQSGAPLTQIATKQLSYAISNKITTNSSSTVTCVTNSECKTQGYDCCSLGQCAKDLALKPGVDTTSTNYVQALQDILNSPSHVYLYPQYYFICSTPVNSPTPPTSTTNPNSAAAARLKELGNLYSCTTKLEGELGLCTTTISNALVSTLYTVPVDDKNFSTTYTNQSISGYAPTQKADLISIQEVSYGEVTLFNYDQILLADESIARPDPYVVSSYLTISGQHNDDNTTGASVKLTALPSSAVSTDLVIKYKIDASCVQQNSVSAKCEKYYIQGQQKSGDTLAQNKLGRTTDHYPASNIFKLPYYADTNKKIIVEVDGITQKQDIDWQLNSVAPASINFLPTSTGGMRVNDTQKVKITYFTDLSVYHVMDSKLAAQNIIKTKCGCADLTCTLKPVLDTTNAIVDYACIYQDATPSTPPLTQTVYLSSKNVPVRYFDTTGTSKATITGDTLAQEGKAFSYRSGNLLNPNNMPDIVNPVAGEDTYVGFNEIYGSLTYATNGAKPAKEVSVVKGKTYDIYVDSGAYSNCTQCGNDYYSQLNKLFPMASFGGGIIPLQARTDRAASSGIPADDFSFGRACFVPASMLPFSHAVASDPQIQRQNRMRAQHFLYANGYQHDWFGFDYGAVIGSFDGVKWFAIGSNRRIKADTNKLFIAVNGPFGDLAIESTYTVSVNDGSLNPIGSNMISSDLESDGAQCQKFHVCSTDNDCATTLGWDYACTDVNQSTSSWPSFDDNAKEIPDSQREDLRMTNILGLSTSGKRCVYRGRGSACTQNYLESALPSTNFNTAANQSLHTCSSNNYCQSLQTNGALSSTFNNRISRYGKVRVDSSSDSIGFGVKVPGRPMQYNAIEQMRSETYKNFNTNKVGGICIPGRSPEAASFTLQNSTIPTSEYTGDKILGIGMSYKKATVTDQAYLASCAIMDDSKNYFYAKSATPNGTNSLINNPSLIYNSGTQAISTNALVVFTNLFTNKGLNFNLLQNNSTVISAQTFTENRCMRAPGASCFSDLDCAPSKLIADKVKSLTVPDSALEAIMNKYEIKFWQEELVCSQATAKSDSAYSAFNNRCCREVGKTISLPSADTTLPLAMSSVPGIDVSFSNTNRYSRVATVYKDTKVDPTNFPALSVAAVNQCASGTCKNITLSNMSLQYKTFSAFAERTSCSGDWVRNFTDGKHIWDKSRFQKFDLSMFKCMNWLPGSNNYSCTGDANDPTCMLVQTTPASGKGKAVLNYLGKMELMGIPQIALESEDYYDSTTEGDFSCRSNPTDQSLAYPNANYMPPTQLFAAGAVAEYSDASSGSTLKLYSAVDETNFTGMKKIFKSDEVVSCLPAGTIVAAGADPSLCCTGFINANRCQLNDYVDISVYTNRYVSSEARKLDAGLVDTNGYIKDPGYVAQLACEKSMCASGKIAYGLLISNLLTPGQPTNSAKRYRFLQNTAASDDFNKILTIYNNGLKLNNHAYCYPTNGTASEDITIKTCGN